MERVQLEIKNIGINESGMTLVDREGNYYVWRTKHYKSPLFYSEGEWVKVAATISGDYFGKPILKNVRVVKE